MEQRGARDLMRTRLRLVEKCVSAQNSIDRLLELGLSRRAITRLRAALGNFMAVLDRARPWANTDDISQASQQ
jgi:hypothetical protein